MPLPSLVRLFSEAAFVGRRFPLTLLCALVLCAVGNYVIRLENQAEDQLTWLFPALSAAGLGLTLTLSVALAAERYRWPQWGRVLSQVAALGLLGLWYWACPSEPTFVWGLRLALLLLASHLLVAVVPYLTELRREADTPGFWRYNETLFLRLIVGGIYSGVLFAGCALALVAVENLFGIPVAGFLVPHLFVVLATVFNTWFFLAGVPHDFAALEPEAPYPKGLKLFTQFVLLPLVVLYLGILYAYLARIVVLWQLPKGWVSVLVLAFSVAGIFALLLIHPIRNAAENTWIRTFARWFYRALFPLLGLLVVAIGTRVRKYGITEERYLVLILAGWLLAIAVYFLWRQGRGIIWIPASLAGLALLAAGGPWGAFAVAERSQLHQLETLANRYRLLQNGKLDGAGKRVNNLPRNVRRRIASVFDFFAERDATARLQPYFKASLALPAPQDTLSGWLRQSRLAYRLSEVSGIEQFDPFHSEKSAVLTANFVSAAEEGQFRALGAGLYWLAYFGEEGSIRPHGRQVVELVAPEGTYRLHTINRGHDLWLEQQRPDGTWHRQLHVAPGTLADSLAATHGRDPGQSVELPAATLQLTADSAGTKMTLMLSQLYRNQRQDTVFYDFSGQVMLKLNSPSNRPPQ